MLSVTDKHPLFRQIITLKAKGYSWDALAVQLDQPSAELQQLPWLFPQSWDEEYARAEALERQELITQTAHRLNTAIVLTADHKELMGLSDALTRLLRLQQPKVAKQPAAKEAKPPTEAPPSETRPNAPPQNERRTEVLGGELPVSANASSVVEQHGGLPPLTYQDTAADEDDTELDTAAQETAPPDAEPITDEEWAEFIAMRDDLIFADMLKTLLHDKPEMYKQIMNIAQLDPEGDLANAELGTQNIANAELGTQNIANSERGTRNAEREEPARGGLLATIIMLLALCGLGLSQTLLAGEVGSLVHRDPERSRECRSILDGVAGSAASHPQITEFLKRNLTAEVRAPLHSVLVADATRTSFRVTVNQTADPSAGKSGWH